MSTGEEWFRFGWHEYSVLLVILGVYLLLSFRDKLPSMRSFKDFLDAINSAGGHIFILALFSVYSIKITMQFIYHILSLPGDMVTKQQAVISTGLGIAQGLLLGNFIGALIKTMSGGKANGTTPAELPPPPAAPAAALKEQ